MNKNLDPRFIRQIKIISRIYFNIDESEFSRILNCSLFIDSDVIVTGGYCIFYPKHHQKFIEKAHPIVKNFCPICRKLHLKYNRKYLEKIRDDEKAEKTMKRLSEIYNL